MPAIAFKFELGDKISHKIDKTVHGIVVERRYFECAAMKTNMYIISFLGKSAGLYEAEAELATI